MSMPSDQRPQEHSCTWTKLNLLIYSKEGIDTPQRPTGFLSEDSESISHFVCASQDWSLCWEHPSWQGIILNWKLSRSTSNFTKLSEKILSIIWKVMKQG